MPGHPSPGAGQGRRCARPAPVGGRASRLATDVFTRAQADGKLGELAFKQGNNKAGIEVMEQSLRLLGRRVPSHTVGFLLFLVWEVLVQSLQTLLPKLFLSRRSLQGTEKTDVVPQRRRQLLNIAVRVARQALAVARTFQTDLPHALRECGLNAALRGQVLKARQHLDESLAVAERQGARFEHAQTLLARGRVGQQHGWPEAAQDLTTARQALRALGGDFALDDATAS